MEGVGLVSLAIPQYHFNTDFRKNRLTFFSSFRQLSVRPYMMIVKFRSALSFQRYTVGFSTASSRHSRSTPPIHGVM